MELIISTFIFVLGAIIGSFLNVVILRYNTGRSIISGRSVCFSCAKKLGWYNMIPILSFIFQGGKCNSCFSRISWQYPTVEFITAIFFTLLYLKLGFAFDLIFYAVIFSLLIVIAVYDLRHRIIPDNMAYLLAFLAFVRLVYIYVFVSRNVAVSSFLSGAVMFLFLGSFWFFSNGKWMGFGDAKLMLGLGWLNSLCYGITGMVYAFWLGAAIGVLINLLFKRIKEVPFAPFLIAGFLVVFFFDSNLFDYLGSLACIK